MHMQQLTEQHLEQIIAQSLKQSFSYESYIDLMKELVDAESTTGHDQSESMVNYTKLNDRRMKRWNATLKLTQEAIETIQNYSKKVIWLVITESWCGDAAHVLPVINKVASLNKGIDLKLVLRDDNPELMDLFLTNGSKSIPKLIILDGHSKAVLGTYGPRPSVATKMVSDYKAEHGKLTAEFKEDLQMWYNKDKGQTTVEDLIKLLK